MKKETTICRICLEAVSNFICTNCLFKAVSAWLSYVRQEHLHPILRKKHEEICRLLESDENGENNCIVCKKSFKKAVCPCCYFYEMYLVVKRESPEVAREFEKVFNFDFNFQKPFSQLTLIESLHKQLLSTRRFKPVIITYRPPKNDINICEWCGQASDHIKETDGYWLCESCRNQL